MKVFTFIDYQAVTKNINLLVAENIEDAEAILVQRYGRLSVLQISSFNGVLEKTSLYLTGDVENGIVIRTYLLQSGIKLNIYETYPHVYKNG